MNKMPSLVELNLSGCKSILSRNLYCLKTAFQNLKIFSLAKVFLSDDDGALLVQTLPSTLISLDLSFNPIAKSTIRALLPNSKNFTSFHLKSLSLGYCRCIDWMDLAYVVTGLYKHLEYLSIPGCFQLDQSFLDILLSSPFFSSSSTLYNSNRKSIGIVALKTLDISFCSQFLSSSTLSKINQNCKFQILKNNIKGFNHNHIYNYLN
ncbi:hypothetical protein DICPUDRAFT_93312 [Dictyostelium purpureum]|uniref:Uncharacterized protein n=1 Tax=Dictyostelium purpureum TaxID=5786 RepID=F1A5J7_DICPU|nr:uncharacterized protein DICPUDRAFT_93312 [Dictyostelium purpureum]EGC28536.1 hypothetical protein DICPUDRAFT_93312 [Dictyostelium purpureum]|eukprot:XP_003294941.1 hypothetical protein DICPUDRAFT_93312 [Dictyostelium purpureum]